MSQSLRELAWWLQRWVEFEERPLTNTLPRWVIQAMGAANHEAWSRQQAWERERAGDERPRGSLVTLCPMTLREARVFIDRHHRHHRAPQGGLFAIGAADGETVIGVAIVGMPVSRWEADGWTVEVTRLCVLEGHLNACSMLYAAAWRAARAMGWRRIGTYILETEPGTSLVAAGWKLIGEVQGGSWSRPSRPRVDLHPTQGKLRWEVAG